MNRVHKYMIISSMFLVLTITMLNAQVKYGVKAKIDAFANAKLVLQTNSFFEKEITFKLFNPFDEPLYRKDIFVFHPDGTISYQDATIRQPNSFYCGVGIFYLNKATWKTYDNGNLLINFNGGYTCEIEIHGEMEFEVYSTLDYEVIFKRIAAKDLAAN